MKDTQNTCRTIIILLKLLSLLLLNAFRTIITTTTNTNREKMNLGTHRDSSVIINFVVDVFVIFLLVSERGVPPGSSELSAVPRPLTSSLVAMPQFLLMLLVFLFDIYPMTHFYRVTRFLLCHSGTVCSGHSPRTYLGRHPTPPSPAISQGQFALIVALAR